MGEGCDPSTCAPRHGRSGSGLVKDPGHIGPVWLGTAMGFWGWYYVCRDAHNVRVQDLMTKGFHVLYTKAGEVPDSLETCTNSDDPRTRLVP